MARRMHLLNSLGHLSLAWEEQNDAMILPAIDSMLERGFKFFILSATGEPTAVVSAIDVAARRNVIISDAGLQELYEAGVILLGGISIEDDAETTGELAKTADAVVENDTLVTQPAHGG